MMRKTLITCLLSLLVSVAVAQQGFNNPVIGGFHPDPSVCRVGNDFYLVNSSFQYFPGVPIYHSRDLIHWEQIGNVLDREEQLPLQGASSWTGIYAPTIRYHEGTYYMITTNVGGGGNFMVTASRPDGPWSKPVWLKQGGIDPSLLFEDGKCYMVSNPDDGIWLCEINPETGEQLTESRWLWSGTGGRYPEGPHLYKKDGYYYLLISEGGTEYGHSITMARSRNIYGPYEANPDNPILCHQRRITEASPIQGTGHGDLVQAADGSWWMVFLAFRTFGGNYHHLGRETFLAPVAWDKGQWPVVNGDGTVALDMAVPTLTQHEFPARQRLYDFTALHHFSPEWLFMQNPVADRYLFTDKGLVLGVSESSLSGNQTPTFVGMRQESPATKVTARVDVSRLRPGAEAGLTVYQIHDGCYRFFAERGNLGNVSVKVAFQVKNLTGEHTLLTAKTDKVLLSITSHGDNYHFSCSATDSDTGEYRESGDFPLSCAMLSSEVAGGFTGVVIGMYAAGKADGGSATFASFSMEEPTKTDQ